MLSIGLMSGTSMDGIDAALLETDGSENLLKSLGHSSITYAPEFKTLLKITEYAVRQYAGNLQEAETHFEQALQNYLSLELKIPESQLQEKRSELASYLEDKTKPSENFSLNAVIQHSAQLHAFLVKKLLKESGYDRRQIAVLGYPGQTLLHQPALKISIIVGKGQYLADELGIRVVTDFRSQDLAAGGQGAPFAPLYHQALALRDKMIPAAVVNCGGIANITLINSSKESELIAFDTGPGNGLLDRLIRQRSKGKECMDKDGHYGKQGKVNKSILKILYEQAVLQENKNYLLKQPPKALDLGDLRLIPELDQLSLEDACATLETFTAESIVTSLKLLKTEFPSQWILAGGGWKNPVIRYHLEESLRKHSGKQVKILDANEVGWNNQAMEAEIFAYLAVRSLQNKALSLPGTTGVPRPLSGGRSYLPRFS